ncbi:lysozyme 1-like [Melanaphis sacchari]|uniref:lysozyme n=1 Tax=Melanaphis sacchari TaxID=742174 RepID=A0A2H8TGX0_9HEMI|nr:lysozyme 1-like [Melanaphis sacchari]
MASHIIFITTVLCLIALSISVTAIPHIHRVPIDNECLKCICEGVGFCNPKMACQGKVCGMFGLTREYWIDAGRPITSGTKTGDKDAYEKCAQNPYCAKQSVINYMKKFYEDCNGDGIVDCYDYGAIHMLGGYRCKGRLTEDFKERFLACYSKS